MSMSKNMETPIRLLANTKSYEWSKTAENSRVADLLYRNIHEDIDEKQHYGELSFSTHPNFPSSVQLPNNERKSLKEYIHHSLPYIFKVLSVDRTLPLKLHPDKQFAKYIHNQKRYISKIFVDDNHKPGFLVAITNFELIVGIRPLHHIEFFLQTVPEFRYLVGEQITNNVSSIANDRDYKEDNIKIILKQIFNSILMCNKEEKLKYLHDLIMKIQRSNNTYIKNINNDNSINLNSLILRLQNDCPNDIGIFSVFFLNCLSLQSGDSLFIDVNTPHAYLKGDCFECTACSDNVVNVAFTKGSFQPALFCQLVNYTSQEPNIIKGHKITSNTIQYDAPLQEVRLEVIKLNENKEDEEILKIDENIQSKTEYHSVILVLEGEGYFNDINISKGDAFLITPDTERLKFQNRNNNLIIARCFTPVVMEKK